jgi:hypothetical protein
VFQPVALTWLAGPQVGSRGGIAYRMVWDFVLAHTDDLLMRYGGRGAAGQAAASYSLGRRLRELTKGLVKASRVEEI